MKFKNIIRNSKRWYYGTPERALDEAYRAALKIEAVENDHFQGQKVCAETCDRSDRVLALFETEVKKYLKKAKIRLAEFNATRDWLNDPDESSLSYTDLTSVERSSIILEKLDFIDKVISKYEATQRLSPEKLSVSLVAAKEMKQLSPQKSDSRSLTKKKFASQNLIESIDIDNNKTNLESAVNKRGVVPRSILNTLNRIKREIGPNAEESEEEVVDKFRQDRNRTSLAIKFLLLLVIIPLLTHQLTKTFIFKPAIAHNFFNQQNEVIFLNKDLQDEAFEELEDYERTLKFSRFLKLSTELNQEEIEEELNLKVEELADKYRDRGADAVANIFADLASVIAFGWVIFISQEEVKILKGFIDELVYGLSDSAKAFLIILFTDMFVGFHSPHGWEVILSGITRHFGLPESHDFDFLFIATFPVILDTVLKYWIFRYLNRISPSAVATYKTMNE
ncbi:MULTISPECIES: proton extrusion protein PcxA [Spirulina sp. CCY15215]|uniref:proton extrusion protein PcxA n=1 Tax=Spirulina sp. CCY15215 TaxID=2767591 RepID=UPI00194F00BA|nr:proton extrusion protein PcxA [Spirulina major]